MKSRKKITSAILSLILIFQVVFFVPTAKAQWVVADPIADIQTTLQQIAGTGTWIQDLLEWADRNLSSYIVTAAKYLALMVVQETVAEFIGEGDGMLIRDYKNYLYTAPNQRTMTQMDNFFKSTSGGRSSAYNYEGIGSTNYHAYLEKQSKKSIKKETPKTTLQNHASDPSQVFSTGNMKGIMSYMECGNNPACLALSANNKYEEEFSKQQDVARSEQQNGLLPKKVNGRIVSPAFIAQNAFAEVDKVGTALIMEAGDGEQQMTDALIQIAEGTVISTVSRLANYGISDNVGDSMVRNQSDYPFSTGYTVNGNINTTSTNASVNQSYNPNYR